MDIPTPTISKSFSPPTAPRRVPLGSFSGMPNRRPVNGGFNWFGALSFIIFFGAVSWWAGLYGYQYFLNKEKAKIEAEIETLAGGLKIATFDDLEVLGNRLALTQKIIDGHTAILPLLCFLEKNTLTKGVSYESFSYKADGASSNQPSGQSGPNQLTLPGQATSFGSLAYQAQVFEDEKAFAKLSFSGLSVNESDGGKVDFVANINVGQDLIRYKKGMTDTCPSTL